MAGNDALGKQPTVDEEMAKFKGFSVKDGETDEGKATAEEEAAALANRRTHAENIKAANGTPDKGEKAPVELTDAESEAAVAAAQEAAGDEELDDTAKEKAVSDALAAKTKAAEKPKSSQRSFDRRVAGALKAKSTAEGQRDALAAENAALRAQLAGGKPPAKDAPLTNEGKNERKELSGKPDPSDAKKYEYGELDAKYIADLTRWTVLDAQDEAKQKESSVQLSKADEAAKVAFDTARSAFEEAGLDKFGDDFQGVMDSMELPQDDPDYWPLHPVLGELLLESEVGPDIAKELASNPKEARRIHKLSPYRQAAWFGVKETELLANSGAGNEEHEDGTPPAGAKKPLKTLPPRESKAPQPLPNQKLNGAGGNRVPNSATADFAAFEAMARSGGK